MYSAGVVFMIGFYIQCIIFVNEVALVLGSIYLRQRERLNASRTRDMTKRDVSLSSQLGVWTTSLAVGGSHCVGVGWGIRWMAWSWFGGL